jgi:hypothetical protein
MIKLPVLVALLAAIGMIGVACGGGSGSSSTPTATTATTGASQTTGTSATQAATRSAESDYFAKVAVIFTTGQTGSTAANDTLNTGLDAAQTLDAKKTAISNFLDTMIIVFDRATNDMSALDRPSAAKDAHDLFMQDIQAAKQKSSDLKDQLGGVTSDADLNAIVDQFNTEVDALVTDANKACVSLQTLADSDGITVNLDCGS